MFIRLILIPAILTCICLPEKSAAQEPPVTDLPDSAAVKPIYGGLLRNFFRDADSAAFFADQLLEFGNRTGDYQAVIFAKQLGGEAYRTLGNFPLSLAMQFDALRMSRDRDDRRGMAFAQSFIGFTYEQSGLFQESLKYLLPSKIVLEKEKDFIQSSFTASNTAYAYMMLGDLDSAQWFNTESLRIMSLDSSAINQKNALRTLIDDRLGNLSEIKGDLEGADAAYRTSLHYAIGDDIAINISLAQKNLARLMKIRNMDDSAIYYAHAAILSSSKDKQKVHMLDACSILYQVFKKQHKTDSALYYLEKMTELREKVYGTENFRRLHEFTAREQELQQQRELEQAKQKSNQRIVLILVIAFALIVLAVIQQRNNRLKNMINRQLQVQKSELEKTLAELKSTQAQLIQSEKMASLGQLTAGIAHEIQNPLNFVNNFSEVNRELLSDMKTEIQRGKVDDAIAIADDVISNENKISHHGRRAEAIVKSMLQHSRSSSGEREPTDINALVEEYLHLAYHALKDKNFNVKLETSLDEARPVLKISRDEIGRVLLNLYTNAFHACAEKSRLMQKELSEGHEKYVPEVFVSTRQTAETVEIEVRDNGIGIPELIADKIFQPFFTTKPTGEGTGLGLSIAYDIVHAHGGQLELMTKQVNENDIQDRGVWTAFLIRLFVNR